jgi:hypothetical protein
MSELRALSVLSILALAATVAAPALAHVTPNVTLQKRGDFARQSLPGATRFLEQTLTWSRDDLAAVKSRTSWAPSEEDLKIYLGRDDKGRLLGTAIFLWVASEHGPVGVAVAFDPAGKVLQAAVTDVGSEPLAWVRPLLDAGGMAGFAGLLLDATPDAAKLAPAVTGTMSRYYAGVIVSGLVRAQAVERVSLPVASR